VLDGTGTQNISVGTNTITSGTFTVNKASGAAVLTANLSVNATGQDLALTSGTLDLAGFNLTVNDSFVVSSGAGIRLQGVGTVSTPTLNSGSTVTYYGDNTGNTLTMKNWSYKNLTINDANVTKDVFQFGENHTGLEILTITAGTFCMNGYNVTTSGAFTCASGATICMKGQETVGSTPTLASGSTCTYKGDNVANTKTCKNWTYKNLTFNDSNGNQTTFKFGETHTGIATFTMTAGIFSQSAGDFAITCTGFTQSGGQWIGGTTALTTNGNFAVNSGIFTSTSGTLTVTGNFAHPAGTFTHNSGTVALTGTNQQVTGSSTFSTLTKTSGGNTLTFGAGATQTIATALTLQGTVGSYMNLRSTTPGTFTLIQFPATRALKYLDFSDIKNNVAANPVYVQDCRRSGQTYGIIFPGF
jgi:hypothetical protein